MVLKSLHKIKNINFIVCDNESFIFSSKLKNSSVQTQPKITRRFYQQIYILLKYFSSLSNHSQILMHIRNIFDEMSRVSTINEK